MNKNEFIEDFENAINNDYLYVGVIIYTEGNPSQELIINHRASFKNKYEYYLNAYDDEMELKATKGRKVIKITKVISFNKFNYLDFIIDVEGEK